MPVITGGFVAGGVSVLVGGGLAFATVTGVVSTVSAEPATKDQPDVTQVLNYGE